MHRNTPVHLKALLFSDTRPFFLCGTNDTNIDAIVHVPERSKNWWYLNCYDY